MTVVTADFLSLAGASTDAFTSFQLNCPIIGYNTVLTVSDVVAGAADADFPITNVANPATHLKWKSTSSADTFLNISSHHTQLLDYVAFAGHNLGSIGANISMFTDGLGALLHFNGTNGSTTFTSNGYYSATWTASGNAQLSTAQFKFGTASLLCDGTGDYITTPDADNKFDLAGNDFTIDMWVRPNASGALMIAGQCDAAGLGNANSAWRFRKNGSNFLEFAVVQGTSVTTLNSTTVMNNATWYHIAAVRNGDVIYLFLDGVLQMQSAFTGAVNNSNQPMTVGRSGSITGTEWNGWIDEFHIWLGGAIWSSAFTPPTAAWTSQFLSTADPTDDSPLIIRFPVPTALDQLDIELASMSDIPQIAVIYLGKLLVLERSIKLDPWHVPINLGRRTRMVNGMSESGNFLGRIVLSQYSETKASFQYMTQDFYRNYVDDFVIAAKEIPFFWAWNPTENGTDTGYSWLVEDPKPAIDPVTRRVEFELNMRAVTE